MSLRLQAEQFGRGNDGWYYRFGFSMAEVICPLEAERNVSVGKLFECMLDAVLLADAGVRYCNAPHRLSREPNHGVLARFAQRVIRTVVDHLAVRFRITTSAQRAVLCTS